MKIEFSTTGRSALARRMPPPPLPEERLLTERDERHEHWRSHLHSYLSVNSGLLVMNLVMAVLSGSFVLWALFPIVGWGIGFGLHTLNYRSWLNTNQSQLAAAEARLGIAAPHRRALAAPSARDPWPSLIQACRDAVHKTQKLVAEVHPAATAAQADLSHGLAQIEQLAKGGQRMLNLLRSLASERGAPAGQGPDDGLERQIADLDKQICATADGELRDAHLANRALLIARRAKIEALRADHERMLAKARGFLLAVENLHLDAARLSGPDAGDTLSAPIQRLTEEVQILSRVDAELKPPD